MNIERFIDLIGSSLNLIKQEYFMITTTYRPLGIVRERVFCYELYHQMRCLQEEMGLGEIHIHGEIDKSGHDLFRDAPRNPDFIFHVPGTMDNNSIVVEVKGSIRDKAGVLKDLQTLSKFTDDKHKYCCGILVIFNTSMEEFKRLVEEYLNLKIVAEGLSINRIMVLCKKKYGAPVESKSLSAILK